MANMLHCLIYRFTRSRVAWWVVFLFLAITLATPLPVDWSASPGFDVVLQRSPMFEVYCMVTVIWAAAFFGEFEKYRLWQNMLRGKEGRSAYAAAVVAMVMLVALFLLVLGLLPLGAWYVFQGGTMASVDFAAVSLRCLYAVLVTVAYALLSVFVGSLASRESAWSLGIAVAALLSSGVLQFFVVGGLSLVDPLAPVISDIRSASPPATHPWQFVEAILLIVLSAVGFTVRMRRKELG